MLCKNAGTLTRTKTKTRILENRKVLHKTFPPVGIISNLLKVTFYIRRMQGFFVFFSISPSCCGFYFIVVFICPCVFAVSFVDDSQGLWTEAHQCDRAPQWQLPSAAGPWPVPRCLRRWCSPSAHCFFCVLLRLWMRQPFNEQTHSSLAVAQGLQGSVYV